MCSTVKFVCVLLLAETLCCLEIPSNFNYTTKLESTGVKKRSVLTFPPDSVFQINMGISLLGQLEKNSAVVVLAFQQNLQLPKETGPTVVTAREFSIFHHLRDVIDSYGYNGTRCLEKMVCQIAETPLFGGLLEDVITFALSPSKHRSVRYRAVKEEGLVKLVLESERLGKLGGNCTSAFPGCSKTPLDFVSASIR